MNEEAIKNAINSLIISTNEALKEACQSQKNLALKIKLLQTEYEEIYKLCFSDDSKYNDKFKEYFMVVEHLNQRIEKINRRISQVQRRITTLETDFSLGKMI